MNESLRVGRDEKTGGEKEEDVFALIQKEINIVNSSEDADGNLHKFYDPETLIMMAHKYPTAFGNLNKLKEYAEMCVKIFENRIKRNDTSKRSLEESEKLKKAYENSVRLIGLQLESKE